ncbi:uncharacterized protein LOC144114182 isoform X1 [Amblyomma americanum]
MSCMKAAGVLHLEDWTGKTYVSASPSKTAHWLAFEPKNYQKLEIAAVCASAAMGLVQSHAACGGHHILKTFSGRRPPSHPPSPTRSFLPWIQLPHLRSDESRRLAGTIFAANLRKTLPKAARNDSPARTALSPTAKDWNRLPADAVHHTNAAHLKAFIEKTIDML